MSTKLLTPPRIVLVGAPSSGSELISECIRSEFNVVFLSTAELLKTAIEEGIEFGKKVRTYMERNQLIPDKLISEFVINRLNQADCVSRGFLLSGFPKTSGQAKALIDTGIVLDAFVSLELPEAVLLERIAGRRTDPVTGKTYNLIYAPPPDDDVRSRLIRRTDDTEEKLLTEIQQHKDNLPSIIDKFEYVVRIASNRATNFIWNELRPKLIRLTRYQVVFVLGGPGCGKGTQCTKISQTFGYKHLSAGDLLREERNRGSKLADMINDYIVQGKIVPAEITINLLATAMKMSGYRKFLIDGFPRNIENMEAWYSIMDNITILDYVLFFDCPEEVMQDRLLDRGKTSGRSDDNIATIVKRFHTFQIESMPVVRCFRRFGKVRIISAIPPPEVVFSNVSNVFKSISYIPSFQRTIGIIKPDAVADGYVPAILELIASANLVTILTKYVMMTEAVASSAFAEHKSQAYFSELVAFMTSGPSVVVLIEGTDAIHRWSSLMGPANVQKAKQVNPNCIRARFGTSFIRNAVHGSTSEGLAVKDVSFWLDPTSIGTQSEIEFNRDTTDLIGIPMEATLAIMKPLTSELKSQEIYSILMGHGFEIVSEMKVKLTPTLIDSFYAEHKGKSFFENLKKYMQSGPVIAMRLERHAAVKAFRHLLGYTNVDRARVERSDSVRALFGYDGTRNAMHGSDSLQSAAKELSFFFAIGATSGRQSALPAFTHTALPVDPPPLPPISPVKRVIGELSPIKGKKKNKVPPTISLANHNDMALYLDQNIDPIFKGLVERILIKKPADVLAFAIQDLQELHRLNLGSDSGGNKQKLEPLISSPAKVPISNQLSSPAKLGPIQGHSRPNVYEELDYSSGATDGGTPIEVFTNLELAKAEILRMRAIVSTISNNIKDERRIMSTIKKTATASQRAQRRELMILHFNDIYEYEPGGPKSQDGGASRLSWQVKNLANDNPLVLHSGDFLSPSTTSNITHGAHMIQILNCIGVHYGVLGNHDLDFGLDVLRQQLSLSTTTWICSNLVDPETQKPIANCQKDVLITWQGVSVGIMGLIEDWLVLCPKVKKSEALYLDIFAVAQQTYNDLKRRGAEVVIALTHCRNVLDEELSRRVPDINLILGGHDHGYYSWKYENSTYGVKSGCDFRDISKVRISFKENQKVPKVHWPPIRIGITKALMEDREVEGISNFYRDLVGAKMKVAIAYSDSPLDATVECVRARESALGNMVTDFMRAEFNTDVAILNGGFIRSDSVYPAGFLTMADISRIFPFPDVLTWVELTGEQLRQCLENGVSRAPSQDGRYCHLSGISVVYNPDAQQKNRIIGIKVKGKDLDLKRVYSCAVNGFMGGGNEGYKIFKDLPWKVEEEFCPRFFTVVTNHLKKTKKANIPAEREANPTPQDFEHIRPRVEGRITTVMYDSDDVIYGDTDGNSISSY